MGKDRGRLSGKSEDDRQAEAAFKDGGEAASDELGERDPAPEAAPDPVAEKRTEILNQFPDKEILSAADLTGSRERSAIIDPLPYEDIHYSIPLTEDADGYLQDPHWLRGTDKLGKPARTMKPLKGHTIIMCPRWFWEAQNSAQQAELDVLDGSLAERTASGIDESDDPSGGYGTPDVTINRGTLTPAKGPSK